MDDSGRLSSPSVLTHFTALYVPSCTKMSSRVHFDGARTRLECTQDLVEVNRTRPRIVPVGKYGLMLVVPVGSNQGNTVVN